MDLIIIASVIIAVVSFVLAAITLRPAKKRSGYGAPDQNIETFIRKVQNSHNYVQMVSGELNPKVFENAQFLSALQKASQKKVDIRVIGGPEIGLMSNLRSLT
jgi:hypothetical protein